ncbi:MAG TPA: FHA domain-containing protein [Xanthomonadales bacterium]|nr:FHA domain-containing protein [Xanthomonadales bacterium]
MLAQPGELTIGSAGDNHVVLQADGVQPHHACIVVDNRGFTLFVRDADAWTHVNARPVREKAILRFGDVVSLQSVNIVLKPDSDDIVSGDTPKPAGGALAEAQMPPKVVLRGVSGPYFGKVIAVQSQLTIGKGTDCDLVLDEPEMSRKHARIEIGATEIAFRDLGSTNGTSINGVQVRDAMLYTGDQIAFASNRFLVEAPGTPVRRNVPREASAAAPAAAGAAPGPQPQVTQTMRAIRIDTPAPSAAPTPEPAPQGQWNPWWLIAAGALIAVGIGLLLLGLR